MEKPSKMNLLNYKGISAMMKKRGKITLPSLSELPEIDEYLGDNFPTLSDFTIANGAHVQRRKDKFFDLFGVSWHDNPNKLYTGEIWTRELRNDKIATYDFLNKKISAKKAEATDICLMPRFRNPDALGVGITEWQGEVVLTIDDKIVALPDYNVDDNQIDRGLLEQHEPYRVGEYRNPNYYPHAKIRRVYNVDDKEQTYTNDNLSRFHKVFAKDGESYTRVIAAMPKNENTEFSHGAAFCLPRYDYWFVNRPVRAMRCMDGSIQILDQIGPRRFESASKFHEGLPAFNSIQELNVDAFEIGKYLCGLFDDMKRSTEFTNFKTNEKLIQPVNFSKSGLKADLHKTADNLGISK